MHSHTHSPFKDRTRLADALETLLGTLAPHDRRESIPVGAADGRVVAEPIVAERAVPHYSRAAMDGYAVRAEDTFGASERAPTVLREQEEKVGPGDAVKVHTGSELPTGADAVVMIEHVEAVGGELEVFDAVAGGENVAPVGEDVERGQPLYDPGHRLRPSDLGLLRSIGRSDVTVAERPTVGVIPTGEELVDADPDPGEVIETNGLTVARFVSRWGGEPAYRDIVTDDPDALRAAVERDLSRDVVVTTGGSSVGERDLIPGVVDELGEVLVHGVAIRPGHPVALGRVRDTPIVMLPGYPVSCIINAVQFLRPAVKHVGGLPRPDHPTVKARLTDKIRSEPGMRTFARVSLETTDGGWAATAVRASGAGVLSSVALADGWVEVPESAEGIAAGETVAVQDWEWSA